MISSGIISRSVQDILIWFITENKRHLLVLSLLWYSEMTAKLITFNHLASILVKQHWELDRAIIELTTPCMHSGSLIKPNTQNS